MQQGALTREVPLPRVLLVWGDHRPWYWDYIWDLTVAGTMCMGKVFSNRKMAWILLAKVPQRYMCPPG